MELNGRMMCIIQEVASSEGRDVPIKQICDLYDIKRRTFYYDLKNVNSYLAGRGLEEIVLEEGHCTISERGRIQLSEILSDSNIEYFKSSYEREIIISLYIGLASGKLMIPMFCRMFDISKNTILSDLRNIKEDLGEYDIELNFGSLTGYEFVGTESLIRNYLYDQFKRIRSRKTRDDIYDFINNRLCEITNNDGYDYWLAFKDCLVIYEELLGTNIVDVDIDACVFVMAMAYIRNAAGHRYHVRNSRRQELKGTSTFDSASVMMQKIEEYLGLSTGREETYYIVSRLISMQHFDLTASGQHDPKIAEFTEKYIGNVERFGNFKFPDRDDIVSRMANHIAPMLYRIAYDIQIKNPLLDDVKDNYADAFDLAVRAMAETDARTARKVSDDELAYLAIHIKSGISERSADGTSNRILIVCAEGVAAALMLQNQLEALLGKDYEYELSSIKNVLNLRLDDYLVVVTTLSNEYLRSNALRVKLILSDENERMILEHLGMKRVNVEIIPGEMIRIIDNYTGDKTGSKDMKRELLKYLNSHRIDR